MKENNVSNGSIPLAFLVGVFLGMFIIAFVFHFFDSEKPKHESIININGSKHHWQQWAIVDKEFNTITPMGDTIKLTIDYPKSNNHDQQ